MPHSFLDLVGKGCQVHSQSIEKLPLRGVGSQIANQPALGRVRAELFQMLLIILHRAAPFAVTLRVILSGRSSGVSGDEHGR
jgi:hypothetical protein